MRAILKRWNAKAADRDCNLCGALCHGPTVAVWFTNPDVGFWFCGPCVRALAKRLGGGAAQGTRRVLRNPMRPAENDR